MYSHLIETITPIQVISIIKNVKLSQCKDLIYKESIKLHTKTKELVQPKTSNIPNAGNGLFATSDISIGTVLATYGGIYIPPIPTQMSYDVETKLLVDLKGDYIIHCNDGGGWIDGQHHTHTLHDVAHISNHSHQPNAVMIPIQNIPTHLGVKSLPQGTPWYYCPHEESIIPFPNNVRLKTMALINIKQLQKGEEVFFDYGINPEHNRPTWYKASNDYDIHQLYNNIISNHQAK